MKSGNGNEKVGIPTFEFSAGRRQCCLVAIEYCVLSVLKANFYSARAEIGRRTRGQVHTPAIYGSKYGVLGLKISIFAPPGLPSSFWWGEKVGNVGILASWRKVGIPTLFPL